MPGLLWYPFRQGHRSEYLAVYILSALGIVVPVPQQEDIGADFYCSLAKSDGKRLTFYAPYLVQAKSSPVKDIAYGGIDENRRWKKEEVEWLFNQETPLLIAIVDKKDSRLDLYSTSNIWGARYSGGNCGQLVLFPNGVDSKQEVPSPTKRLPDQAWPEGTGDGYVWEVPLGPALVSLSLDDVENEDRITTFRSILSEALYLDQANITYRRLNVHFSRWLHRYATNQQGGVHHGVFYAWNSTPGVNTGEQLQSLSPIITALANNLKAQGRTDELKKLRGTFELLPEEEIPDFLRSKIPELFLQ